MARSKTKKTRDTLTYETLPALFTGICDAIRGKTGGSDPINHQDIPASITAIPTSSGVEVLENFSGTFSLPSAGTWKSHTMTKAGYVTVIMVCTYTGAFSIRKNGADVANTIAINANTNQARGVYRISVAIGDTIAIYKSADANSPCQMIMLFEEE